VQPAIRVLEDEPAGDTEGPNRGDGRRSLLRGGALGRAVPRGVHDRGDDKRRNCGAERPAGEAASDVSSTN
jgi:hypothetical protein